MGRVDQHVANALTWLALCVRRCLFAIEWKQLVVEIVRVRLTVSEVSVRGGGGHRVIVVVHYVHAFVVVIRMHIVLAVRRRARLVFLKGIQTFELLVMTVHQVTSMVGMMAMVWWQGRAGPATA